MTLDELTKLAGDVVGPGGEFTKRVAFDLGDEGRLFIDGGSGQVDNSHYFADFTIRGRLADLVDLLCRRVELPVALATGTLVLSDGDPALVDVLDWLIEIFPSDPAIEAG